MQTAIRANDCNAVKHAGFQQRSIDRATKQILGAVCMSRRKKAHAAAYRPTDCLRVRRRSNLIHSNPVRGHGADQKLDPAGLAAGSQYVRSTPDAELRATASAGSQFTTLVHQPHAPAALVG